MTEDELFLLTIFDLAQKVKSNTEYDTIRACGLLRHLLLDQPSLYEIVNRQRKIRPFFKICDAVPPTYTPPDAFITITGVRLHSYSKGFREVKLHQFLKTEFLRFNDQYYTVEQFILSISHMFGGVHSYSRQNEKDDAFHSLMRIGDDDQIIQKNAVSISNIVLDGLKPLIEVVKLHTSSGGF